MDTGGSKYSSFTLLEVKWVSLENFLILDELIGSFFPAYTRKAIEKNVSGLSIYIC